MSEAVLDATTSTAMTRTTVHAQYNGRALGVVMLNNLIPIVLDIPKPGRKAYKAVLVFGRRAHKNSPYEDLGVRRKCCRRVLTFNVQHYTKCYLTDDHGADAPYTYNCCRKCNAVLKDACNHLVQVNNVRSYNVDKFIYKAPHALQEAGPSALFKFQERNC